MAWRKSSGRPGTPSPGAALTSSTGFLLARVGAESRRLWTLALAGLDLRPSHYAVLMALDALGPASQQQLAQLTGMDPRNAVALIDQLEDRELLERAPDPQDRRRHSISFTPAGRDAMRRLRRAGVDAEKELLAVLTETEREQLHGLLLKLLPPSLGLLQKGEAGG
jgi:DNA-binding MarR family transcriptional regulator